MFPKKTDEYLSSLYISVEDKVPRNLLICCKTCKFESSITGHSWEFEDGAAYCTQCRDVLWDDDDDDNDDDSDDEPYQPTPEEMKQLQGHLAVIAYCRLKSGELE